MKGKVKVVKKPKKQEVTIPVDLVYFDDKVVHNATDMAKVQDAAISEFLMYNNKYINENNIQQKFYDPNDDVSIYSYMRDQITSKIGNNYSVIVNTMLNLCETYLITFQEALTENIVYRIKDAFEKVHDTNPEYGKSLMMIFNYYLKESSDIILGGFAGNDELKQLITDMICKPDLQYVKMYGDGVENSAICHVYFDKFIMLTYSKLINGWHRILASTVAKASITNSELPKGNDFYNSLTLIVEETAGSMTGSLYAVFQNVLRLAIAARTMDKSAYLNDLDERIIKSLNKEDESDESSVDVINF